MTSLTLAQPLSLEELQEEVRCLAEGAALVYNETGSVEDDHAFGATLVRTLERESSIGNALIEAAVNTLKAHQAPAVALWLLAELELEAECTYLTDCRGEEVMAILFAIPVAVAAGCAEGEAFHLPHADRLHALIEQAEIVSSTAHFGLLPYLFCAEALERQAYPDVYKLTQFLGQQVIDGEGPILELGSHIVEDRPLAQEGPAELRYMVGVAVVKEREAEHLFWEEPSSDAASFAHWNMSSEIGSRGTLPSGELWEDGFLDVLNEAWDGEEAVLGVCTPLGFHDDRRYGRTLQREQNAIELFGAWMSEGYDLGGARLTQHPVKNDDHELIGWRAWVITRDEDVFSLDWPVLPHEEVEEAHAMLMDLLESLGLLPDNARGLMLQAPGRHWLH